MPWSWIYWFGNLFPIRDVKGSSIIERGLKNKYVICEFKSHFCLFFAVINKRTVYAPYTKYTVFRLSVVPWFVITFRFHSISWEQMYQIWPSFAYPLKLTRSRFGLLRVNFPKFITELWPLVDVGISFPLNILRTNWWNVTRFCICIETTSRLGLLRINFRELITELWPLNDVLEFRFCWISWEQIDGIWPNFAYDKIWFGIIMH